MPQVETKYCMLCVALPHANTTASIATTGNGSDASSCSTSPTNCRSSSVSKCAATSRGVRRMSEIVISHCDPAHITAQRRLLTLLNLYRMLDENTVRPYIWTRDAMSIDRLDAALLDLLHAEPKVGVLEASRRLGVARGTVQARLDRLERSGVVRGWGPDVEPAAMGFPVTAFVTLEIRQGGGHDPVGDVLASIPEVIEAHTVTGPGDLWC